MDCTPYDSPKPFIIGNRFYKLLCQVWTNLPPGDEISVPASYAVLKQATPCTIFMGITGCHHRLLTTLLPLLPKHDWSGLKLFRVTKEKHHTQLVLHDTSRSVLPGTICTRKENPKA